MTQSPSISQLKRALDIAEQIQHLESQLASILGSAPARASVPAASAPAASAASAPAAAKTRKTKGGRKGKRTMSPEAREKIAAAQRARWSKVKGTKTAAAPAAKKATRRSKGKRIISAESRAKMAAAQKARWAKR